MIGVLAKSARGVCLHARTGMAVRAALSYVGIALLAASCLKGCGGMDEPQNLGLVTASPAGTSAPDALAGSLEFTSVI